MEENKQEPYKQGPNAFDITPNQDGGVLKEIIKEGVGEYTPQSGCNVKVHYVGSLTDGTRFDSSRKRDEPFSFVLGKGSVIKAWDIGVATMKKGEMCVLTCKSEYAYGKSGSPPTIPPDATLIFEIEMLDWEVEDLSSKKDGGILRTIITPGQGFSSPNQGADVKIHITCECNGKVVDDRTVNFALGEGVISNIPSGVERALEKFKLKEKSKLELSPKYAWGSVGLPALSIPPDSKLTCVVELQSFEKVLEHYEMNKDQRIEYAETLKSKGATYFKDGRYQIALKMFRKAVEFIETPEEEDVEVKDVDPTNVSNAQKQKKLLEAIHLNTSLCYLKVGEHLKAKDECDKAIKLKLEANEKAYFRRGQAYLGLGEPEKARLDFEETLKIDPNNKAAAAQISVCAQKLKEQKAKEKKIYANMFEKFAQRDKEKEEEERKKQPDVMKTLGEWGQDEREREPTDFEKENPNILMLEGTGDFRNM
ncbi:FK506-binding protein 59-like isoform X2 [Nilaparvata lugens]|uniref:FK506-binding protein 59-like isoform X2 n=1 Tax=Nilaparvata lugens TaxID=108931 RepID=UPI000B986E50|nr:FK506-binding protein 59-like isoform X2 [Nilaparvata lugens]